MRNMWDTLAGQTLIYLKAIAVTAEYSYAVLIVLKPPDDRGAIIIARNIF